MHSVLRCEDYLLDDELTNLAAEDGTTCWLSCISDGSVEESPGGAGRGGTGAAVAAAEQCLSDAPQRAPELRSQRTLCG